MSELSPDRKAVLRSIGLFEACSDEELSMVEALVDDIEVDPGEVIIREDALGQGSFVIVSGEASVTVRGAEVGRVGPGNFLGEVALLASAPDRVATVTARTEMHLLVIEPSKFRPLLEIGGVATVMLKGVVHRLSGLESEGTTS